MYKVLIAEDEMLVRLGLKNSIQWEDFHMQVVCDVADGKSAWEAYEKHKPDLIITDIRMPVMDGMELIDKIRKKDRHTVIIILSCLEEFDLVRKAMDLGVLTYIPKLTISETETQSVLEKAKQQLDKRKISKSDANTSKNNTNLYKEKLIKDFIFYNIYSDSEFDVHVREQNLNINSARLVLCAMDIDNYGLLKKRFEDPNGQLIKLSILNVLDELLVDFKKGEAIYNNESQYILLFSFKEILSEQTVQQTLNGMLNKIKEVMTTFFDTSVSFGISSIQSGYSSLKTIYNEATIAIKHKFFIGQGIFYYSNLTDIKPILLKKLETLRHIPNIQKHLNEYNLNEYNKRIDDITKLLPLEKGAIQQFFYQLLQWTSSVMHIKSESMEELVVAANNGIAKSDTVDRLIEAYNKFILQITECVLRSRALSREVSQAVKYLHLNYCENINLQLVAEHVNLSPAYLSSLFKKELLVNFVDYLNELRVNKAKELLLDTYLRSYEIAEKTGFSENTYFSKVFKKFTGTTPNEFRRQWMKEWTEDIENEEN